MSDTTTHSQDPHDPVAQRRIDEARKSVANSELQLQSSMDKLRLAEAAAGESGQSVDSVKLGTPVSFLEGVGEVPLADRHPTGGRSALEVALKKLAVQLDGIAGVISELDRNGGVQPKEQAQRISIVGGPNDSEVEALSIAKKSIRDRMYVGQRNIVDPGPGPVVNERAHNSSPSVDDAGAHSVGDGPGAGDASATPATEVTLELLVEAVTDAHVDERAASRIQCAAATNLAEADENLAYAKNQTLVAVTALSDFIIGGTK